jgi:hypothetical protein
VLLSLGAIRGAGQKTDHNRILPMILIGENAIARELSIHCHAGEMTSVKLLKIAVLCAPAAEAPSTNKEILLVDP